MKNSVRMTGYLKPVTMAAAALLSAQCASVEPQLVGAPQTVSANHKDIERAKNFALSNKRLSSPVKQVTDAQIQTVAGHNYMFDLGLMDGNRFRVVVYEDLEGNMSVTKFESK